MRSAPNKNGSHGKSKKSQNAKRTDTTPRPGVDYYDLNDPVQRRVSFERHGVKTDHDPVVARTNIVGDPLFESALIFEIHHPGDAPMLSEQLDLDYEKDSNLREFRQLRSWILEMPEYKRALADEALKFGLRLSFLCPEQYAVEIAAMLAQTFPSHTFASYDKDARRLIFRNRNEREMFRKAEEGLDVIK